MVAERGAKSLIGRDWLNAFNYKFVSPNQNEGKPIICKVTSGTTKPIITTEPSETTKPEIWNNKQNAKTTQQKGRRVPVQLQKAVQKEIERLLEEGHIEKTNEKTDKQFIQPVAVKKDKRVKIALDARAINNEIVKDKYQMPNLEHLVALVTEQLDNKEHENALHTSLDMRYAYGRVPLAEETAKHCNFQIIGGNATGTYRFITGFYGLTIMPTEFQKTMDQELANLPNTYVFLDDILIVTKGTKEKHFEAVRQVLKRLDNANVRLKWEKCKFAEEEVDWLGYKLSQTGIKPINSKVQAIREKLTPKNQKDFRSYLEAVNQLNRFIPNLAQLCRELRPLLKRINHGNGKKNMIKQSKT